MAFSMTTTSFQLQSFYFSRRVNLHVLKNKLFHLGNWSYLEPLHGRRKLACLALLYIWIFTSHNEETNYKYAVMFFESNNLHYFGNCWLQRKKQTTISKLMEVKSSSMLYKYFMNVNNNIENKQTQSWKMQTQASVGISYWIISLQIGLNTPDIGQKLRHKEDWVKKWQL